MSEINKIAALEMNHAQELYASCLKSFRVDAKDREDTIRTLKPRARELNEAMFDLFEAIERGERAHAQVLLDELKAEEDPASSESKLGYLNAAYAQALIDTMS